MSEEKLITNSEEISLNEQDQVQTILGKPPGWILRWGITFMALAVGVLILISYLVKFPDIIPARVVLTTKVPPVHLFAKTEGRLVEFFSKDKDHVKENQLLGIIENPADFQDVMYLEEHLKSIQNLSDREIAKTQSPENMRLGELQLNYSTFTQDLQDFIFYDGKQELPKKIKNLESKIRYLGQKNKSFERQKRILKTEIDLAERDERRMETLVNNGSESVQNLEIAKAKVLNMKRQLDNYDSQIYDNKLRVKDLELEIINLKENRRDGKNEKSNSLNENIDNLLSSIESWKQKYFLKSGQEIMTVIPKGGVGEIVGNAQLPAINSGKVEVDMKVNIRLDGYPFQEFGVINATVKSKSAIPQDGNYLLEIEMVDSLVTSYGKKLDFQQEMIGTANIITEDRRIIHRIFDRFLDVIKN